MSVNDSLMFSHTGMINSRDSTLNDAVGADESTRTEMFSVAKSRAKPDETVGMDRLLMPQVYTKNGAGKALWAKKLSKYVSLPE